MNPTLNTTDIYFTAYLITHKILPQTIILEGKQHHKKVIFQFFRDQSVESLEQKFKTGTATTNIQAFKGSMEFAKDLMFAKLREA